MKGSRRKYNMFARTNSEMVFIPTGNTYRNLVVKLVHVYSHTMFYYNWHGIITT